MSRFVEEGWFLPRSAINAPMADGLEVLIAHAHRSRWTNAVVRKDSVETVYEADWIKELVKIEGHPLRQKRPGFWDRVWSRE